MSRVRRSQAPTEASGEPLKALHVPVVSREEQVAVIARVDEVRRSRHRLEHNLGTSSRRGVGLHRALLAAAFSGALTANRSATQELACV